MTAGLIAPDATFAVNGNEWQIWTAITDATNSGVPYSNLAVAVHPYGYATPEYPTYWPNYGFQPRWYNPPTIPTDDFNTSLPSTSRLDWMISEWTATNPGIPLVFTEDNYSAVPSPPDDYAEYEAAYLTDLTDWLGDRNGYAYALGQTPVRVMWFTGLDFPGKALGLYDSNASYKTVVAGMTFCTTQNSNLLAISNPSQHLDADFPLLINPANGTCDGHGISVWDPPATYSPGDPVGITWPDESGGSAQLDLAHWDGPDGVANNLLPASNPYLNNECDWSSLGAYSTTCTIPSAAYATPGTHTITVSEYNPAQTPLASQTMAVVVNAPAPPTPVPGQCPPLGGAYYPGDTIALCWPYYGQLQTDLAIWGATGMFLSAGGGANQCEWANLSGTLNASCTVPLAATPGANWINLSECPTAGGQCFGSTVSITVLPPAPGTVFAMGLNAYGQLGNGTTYGQLAPLSVVLPGNVAAVTVSAGWYHSLAVGSDGKIYAWGWNAYGQLGDGTTTNRLSAEAISLPGGVTAVSVSAGYEHSLAVGNDGRVYAWGGNASGQLGDGTTTTRLTPEVLALPAGVSALSVSAGDGHSLAVGSDGNVYAWGWNAYGQLGDGTTTNHLTPEAVRLSLGIAALSVSAGYAHSLAVGSDGSLYAWGYNVDGQLGDGTTTTHLTPEAVGLPGGAIPLTVAAGYCHSLAVGGDGKVYVWGWNTYSQLGDGTTTTRLTPEAVGLPGGVTVAVLAASTGAAHSLAIGNNGQMYAWGWNGYGQLGDSTTTTRATPEAVGLPSGVTARMVSAGAYHTLPLSGVIQPPPPTPTSTATASPTATQTPPGLSAYSGSMALTITGGGSAVSGSTTAPVPTNSTDYVVQVHLTGSQAAAVYNGATYNATNTDGGVAFADVTLWYGGAQIDLDYDTTTYGAWSTNNITLWFKLQRNLAASPATDAAYTLAWGNSNPRILRNLADLYPLQDTFAGSSLDTSKWNYTNGSAAVTVANGLTITEAAGDSNQNYGISSRTTFGAGYLTTAYAADTLGTSAYWNGIYDRFSWGQYIDHWFNNAGNFMSDSTTNCCQGTTEGAGDSNRHTFQIARSSTGQPYYWLDSYSTTNTDPSERNTNALSVVLTVSNSTSTVAIPDVLTAAWVKVRPWIPTEPAVS